MKFEGEKSSDFPKICRQTHLNVRNRGIMHDSIKVKEIFWNTKLFLKILIEIVNKCVLIRWYSLALETDKFYQIIITRGWYDTIYNLIDKISNWFL